jgi:hypothetical protein
MIVILSLSLFVCLILGASIIEQSKYQKGVKINAENTFTRNVETSPQLETEGLSAAFSTESEEMVKK